MNSLSVGLLYQNFGPITMFYCFGIANLVSILFFSLASYFLKRRRPAMKISRTDSLASKDELLTESTPSQEYTPNQESIQLEEK